MPYAGGDRIKETCSNPGAGSFVLTGAVVGEIVRAFSSAENGQYVRYLAKHETAAEAEVGAGLYTHSTRTLTRLHRSYPSEGAGTVTFSAGIVHVANTPSVRDVVPWQAAADPISGDDIADGFIRGNRWINTSSGAVFECVNPAPGAAVWDRINIGGASLDQYDIAARIIAGTGGFVGVAAGDLTEEGTPAAGDFLLGWASGATLRKFDVGDLPTGSGDIAPSTVTSAASPFVLTAADRLSNNVIILSHQASVVFEVPQAAAAGSQWLIMPSSAHTGCTVTINGGVGTLTPNPARIIAGGLVVVTVRSNAGSAPVTEVRGNVIVPSVAISTRTYAVDDHGQEFEATGTQTFSIATASLPSGWTIPAIWNASAGNINIVGLDATHVLPPKGAVTVKRFAGGPLVCIGSSTGSTVTVLDAA